MILNEFKAWFAGITATMGPVPTIEQWELIKKEISAIGVDKVSTVKQGPFVAQEKAPNTSSIKDLQRHIEDAKRRDDEIKRRGPGIDGFPNGWPSKHFDTYPYPDPLSPRYSLRDAKDMARGFTTADTLEGTSVVFFMNPR